MLIITSLPLSMAAGGRRVGGWEGRGTGRGQEDTEGDRDGGGTGGSERDEGKIEGKSTNGTRGTSLAAW